MNNIHFAKVIFEGRVQGIGFRLKIFNIAKGYDVLGYVKNQDDRTVLSSGRRNQESYMIHASPGLNRQGGQFFFPLQLEKIMEVIQGFQKGLKPSVSPECNYSG